MKNYSFLLLALFGCVGPPDPDHGLILNKPVLINSATAFSFTIRSKNHNFDEEYELSLTSNGSKKIISSLIVSDYSGTDTLLIELKDYNDDIIYNYKLNSNISILDDNSMVLPTKARIRSSNFSGIIDWSVVLK